jgi:hypothetical protein
MNENFDDKQQRLAGAAPEHDGDGSNAAYSCPDEQAGPTIEMPRLGGYSDMRRLTGRSYGTIARWVCRKKLRPGIYVGQGLFNIYRIRELFDKNETFFLKRGRHDFKF